MKHFRLIIAALTLIATLAATAQTFTSGRLTYQVVTSNHEVFVAPSASGAPYTNLGSNDLVTEVTYQNQKYKVIGIGAGAFVQATISGNMIIPEGYVYIDNSAFSETDGVMVKIPASATQISPTAFAGNKLSIISVNLGNPNFAYISTKQGNATYFMMTNKEKNMLFAVPGAAIDGTSFVKQVTIPESITEVGDFAFYKNPNVTSINLHKGITRLGHYAFSETKVSSMNFPNPDVELGDAVCMGCNSLTRVTLAPNMKALGSYMFFGCEGLTSITLPEGMKSARAFSLGSTSITTLNLPSTMDVLDSSALQNTPIARIDLKNVKRLGNQCFSMCANLTTIAGGEQLEELDNAVFIRCTALKSTQLPANVKRLVASTYFRCTGLTSAVIPTSVEYIGRNPFVGASALPRIQVEAGSTHYAEADSCLYETLNGDLYRLVAAPEARDNKVLRVREGVKAIGDQACRYGTMTEVYLPKGLTAIEDNAFAGATALVKAELPASTDTLMSQAFNGCTALTHLTVLAKNPPKTAGDGVFSTYETTTLFVPKGSVDAYKADAVWGLFSNIVGVDVPDEGVKGDVNGDGKVEVDDLNLLINAILSGEGIDLNSMDVNGDGKVEIDDLNLVINIILG